MLLKKVTTFTLTLLVILLASCQPAATPAPETNTAVPPAAEPAPPGTSTAEPESPETSTAEPSPEEQAWFKTYGGVRDDVGWDLLVAEDGGCFIAGTTDLQFEPEMGGDVYLVRTDPAGEVLWEKTYEGEGYQEGGSITQTSDGELLISGMTTSSATQGMDIFLLRLDQDGVELESRTFGGPLDEMGAAWPLDDGGFLLGGIIVDPNDFVADPGAAGYSGLEGRSNVYIARVDDGGDELWSRSFGGKKNVLASGGVQAPDGGFLVLATIMYFPEDDNDILLLRVDENGEELWSRTWDEGVTSAYDLIETSDGNYLISASYAPPGGDDRSVPDSLFIKIDPEGNEIWRTVFGEPDMIDYGALLVEAADGSGYYAAGEWGRDLYSHSSDISWVKISPDGDLLWRQIIPTATHNMFGVLRQDPAGGYIMTGSTVNKAGNFDIFVVKTDPQGNAPQ